MAYKLHTITPGWVQNHFLFKDSRGKSLGHRTAHPPRADRCVAPHHGEQAWQAYLGFGWCNWVKMDCLKLGDTQKRCLFLGNMNKTTWDFGVPFFDKPKLCRLILNVFVVRSRKIPLESTQAIVPITCERDKITVMLWGQQMLNPFCGSYPTKPSISRSVVRSWEEVAVAAIASRLRRPLLGRKNRSCDPKNGNCWRCVEKNIVTPW